MMSSSSLRLDKRRLTYVRLIGEIRHALNQALSEENKRAGLTRATIARLLGKDKSFVSRKLNGTSNMTLETLADLAYALDRPVKVVLPQRHAAARSNIGHLNEPIATTSAPAKSDGLQVMSTAV